MSTFETIMAEVEAVCTSPAIPDELQQDFDKFMLLVKNAIEELDATIDKVLG